MVVASSGAGITMFTNAGRGLRVVVPLPLPHAQLTPAPIARCGLRKPATLQAKPKRIMVCVRAIPATLVSVRILLTRLLPMAVSVVVEHSVPPFVQPAGGVWWLEQDPVRTQEPSLLNTLHCKRKGIMMLWQKDGGVPQGKTITTLLTVACNKKGRFPGLFYVKHSTNFSNFFWAVLIKNFPLSVDHIPSPRCKIFFRKRVVFSTFFCGAHFVKGAVE